MGIFFADFLSNWQIRQSASLAPLDIQPSANLQSTSTRHTKHQQAAACSGATINHGGLFVAQRGFTGWPKIKKPALEGCEWVHDAWEALEAKKGMMLCLGSLV